LWDEITAVYCEGYIEHINTICGLNADMLHVRYI